MTEDKDRPQPSQFTVGFRREAGATAFRAIGALVVLVLGLAFLVILVLALAG